MIPLSCAAASAPRDLAGDLQRFVGPERAGLHAVGERLALDQLHREERRLARFLEAEDAGDVRVVERGQQPCLALKASEALRVGDERDGEDLDRHVASELQVSGVIDLAHATGAQGGKDFERAEALAGGQGHRGCGHSTRTALSFSG